MCVWCPTGHTVDVSAEVDLHDIARLQYSKVAGVWSVVRRHVVDAGTYPT
jgi:hypothetical protein